MRWMLVLGLFIGCRGSTAPVAASMPPPAPPSRVVEPPTPPPAPAPVAEGERLVRWIPTREALLALDGSGQVFRVTTPPVSGLVRVPFSEPVEDVVFARSVPRVHRAGMGSPPMFCARTRSAAIECVAEQPAPAGTPPQIQRLQIAAPGRVRQLGVMASPWASTDGVLCAAADTPACWTITHDAQAKPLSRLVPAVAEAAALGLRPAVRHAWTQLDPSVTVDATVEIVSTERADDSRIVGADADISVHCARLASGTLTCFGRGVYGDLGDGQLVTAARVARPLGTTQVLDVAAQSRYICAVTADHRVACWGRLPEDLPLPATHVPRQLPACPLDRAASRAQYDHARAEALRKHAECDRTCAGVGRGGCSHCSLQCPAVPYVFRHVGVCQEPLGVHVDMDPPYHRQCSAGTPPQWRTDRDLADDTPETRLTLAPVYLTGITDAVSIALPGRPSLCLLRTDGTRACIQERRLVPVR